MKKIIIAGAGALIAVGLFAGCSGASTPAADLTAPTTPAAAAPAPAKPAQAKPAEGTPGQQNALRKAESYLEFQAFSKAGLAKQLEFEKFSAADASWAAAHVKANWNDQAAKKAKSYLDTQAFSHGSLVQQLVFEGFTPAEAEHGVVAAGL